MSVWETVTYPLCVAPMAGGPSTPALVRAAADAGALGFLAAGTLSPEEAAQEMSACAGVTYGINFFLPQKSQPRLGHVEQVHQELTPWYDEAGVEQPPVKPIDLQSGWPEMILAVEEAVRAGHGPAVVSATFGCWTSAQIERFHALGVEAWVSVASPEAAQAATQAGADALIVQGPEAGGHRYTWTIEEEPDPRPLRDLVAACAQVTHVPLIAAGGLSSPEAVAQAVKWPGVHAVSCGSAFLLAPEAGTSQANRNLLHSKRETVSTRAFSGRYARGLKTAFTEANPALHAVYPYLNQMLAPLRATGDDRVAYCLVGQLADAIREQPAAETIAWLLSESA